MLYCNYNSKITNTYKKNKRLDKIFIIRNNDRLTKMAQADLTVTFFHGIQDKCFTFLQGQSYTCEEIVSICLKYIRNIGICGSHNSSNRNSTLYLQAFGLQDEVKKSWYPMSRIFKSHSKTKTCRFRVRFRPASIKYEENNVVWEYFIHQCKYELLMGELGKVSYTQRLEESAKDKKILISLCLLSMMIPDCLPQSNSNYSSFGLINFRDKFSPELYQRINSSNNVLRRTLDSFIYYSLFKRRLREEIAKNHDPVIKKQNFLWKLLEMFPLYCFDTYFVKVIDSSLGGDGIFFIKVNNSAQEVLCELIYRRRDEEMDTFQDVNTSY